MSNLTVKEEARQLVEQLPEDATWDDVFYQIYVRQTIDAGLDDCRNGRMISSAELRRRLGLPS